MVVPLFNSSDCRNLIPPTLAILFLSFRLSQFCNYRNFPSIAILQLLQFSDYRNFATTAIFRVSQFSDNCNSITADDSNDLWSL